MKFNRSLLIITWSTKGNLFRRACSKKPSKVDILKYHIPILPQIPPKWKKWCQISCGGGKGSTENNLKQLGNL